MVAFLKALIRPTRLETGTAQAPLMNRERDWRTLFIKVTYKLPVNSSKAYSKDRDWDTFERQVGIWPRFGGVFRFRQNVGSWPTAGLTVLLYKTSLEGGNRPETVLHRLLIFLV